ncbi:D-alanine-D-alanine ligase [Propionispora sp. 2/2-37]|uniref:D-alanine--D-alanine ligase family protein n=1 Tax=Propionispora sp. 2/2-37 TaxID=1677858 RepID=UPI0006BB7D92|nr:D-alanine--D-alanine ligase [Propionispora sp. 2/2-37]CUH94039.1 D-alanine-D-alanine ligase [Propionispora sp. 2/2-37]
MKKVAVVMGGPSAEREVSLRTGGAILDALREKGYHAVGLELVPETFVTQIKKEQIDVVFNAVHGKFGEDGVLQGGLELLHIPYTGSGVLASAMAMDKSVSKRLFLSANIPTPRSCFFNKQDDRQSVINDILARFAIPVVVKAAAQGSSIGVTIVEEAGALPMAVEKAFAYCDDILVEEFIKGREVTVAVWGNEKPEALPVIEIVPHSGRYDYHAKYTSGATEYHVPAQLDASTTQQVMHAAVGAFSVLGCCGVARADIMLDGNNKPYVLEMNTIPGMTATSLVPKAAAAAGIAFPELCERILLMVRYK